VVFLRMRAFFVPVRFSGLGDSKPATARDAGFGFWGVFSAGQGTFWRFRVGCFLASREWAILIKPLLNQEPGD
jgi:hypothetical protein